MHSVMPNIVMHSSSPKIVMHNNSPNCTAEVETERGYALLLALLIQSVVWGWIPELLNSKESYIDCPMHSLR